jgi:hypothetical protein
LTFLCSLDQPRWRKWQKTTTIGAAVSHDHGLEAKRHITTNSGADARQKALITWFAGFNQVYDRWARCQVPCVPHRFW